MPRIARIYTDDGVFHVLTRGNNKQVVFHNNADFDYYKNIVRKLKREQPFKLFHWCLMSNHVHLIIEATPSTELSKLMKRINLSYYTYYKQKYGYAGHFWQDRFKSLLIDAENYLLSCGFYIERNPVRAGMVKTAIDYPHSSYTYYACGKEDGITDQNPLFSGLGRNQDQRRAAYKELALSISETISPTTFNQLFLGDEDFIRRMEKKFEVANVRKDKGRPKK